MPRIAAVEIIPCVMPKEDPKWAFALAANPLSEGWIVGLRSDGVTGYGYGSSTPHMGATYEGLKTSLESFRSTIEKRDPFDLEPILKDLDRKVRGSYQAKAAVDCALHDLQAKLLGIPLNKLIGGTMREEVPLLRILALKTPSEMAANAKKLIAQGYRYLKIKVHGDVEDDVARVKAIRKAVGPSVHLTIDANQSYTVKNAIRSLNLMAEFNVELAEQPVRIDDLRGLKLVTDSVPITVEADESANSLEEVVHLVNERIVDAVSLKIPKLGGLRNTIAAARICEAGAIKYRLGAAVGSCLLAAHGMHLAASLPGVDYACELAEHTRLLNDPFEGMPIEKGFAKLPKGNGVGVRLVKRAKGKAQLAAAE
jgi:L-alanine-DL-glutamate epimerase-like enolase superfamily enzyme